MADPVTTDIFKFVAIRPPQLVPAQETQRTIIRDARAKDAIGRRTLASLANDVARPEAALVRWRELDLAPLAPLADSYRAIVQRYEKLGAADTPPDARQVLQDAGAIKSVADSRILHLAWDAIYIADSTGFDSGPRLEAPMAALRVLHFAELLDREKHPTRGCGARRALRHARYPAGILRGSSRAAPACARSRG